MRSPPCAASLRAAILTVGVESRSLFDPCVRRAAPDRARVVASPPRGEGLRDQGHARDPLDGPHQRRDQRGHEAPLDPVLRPALRAPRRRSRRATRAVVVGRCCSSSRITRTTGSIASITRCACCGRVTSTTTRASTTTCRRRSARHCSPRSPARSSGRRCRCSASRRG